MRRPLRLEARSHSSRRMRRGCPFRRRPPWATMQIIAFTRSACTTSTASSSASSCPPSTRRPTACAPRAASMRRRTARSIRTAAHFRFPMLAVAIRRKSSTPMRRGRQSAHAAGARLTSTDTPCASVHATRRLRSRIRPRHAARSSMTARPTSRTTWSR